MKNVLYVVLFVFAAFGIVSAQSEPPVENLHVRVAADPAEGFAYPYYYYVPKTLREGGPAKERTILVLPNNSGKSSDDPNFQEDDVETQLKKNVGFADRLGVILIEPAFPRPAKDWQIYT